jgi:hypothetical protein
MLAHKAAHFMQAVGAATAVAVTRHKLHHARVACAAGGFNL